MHRCCHLVGYNRSCSVLTTVSVHFYKLGDAGTLFANNQRCRNARPCVPRHFNHSSWIFPILHNMGQKMPPKLPISLRRAGMPHNNLFLGPTDPISKQHLNPFSRSSTAHGCHQQTDTQIMLLYTIFSFCFTSPVFKSYSRGGLLAEWTQVQKGPGSNRIRDAVG